MYSCIILISKFRKPSNFSKNEIQNCTIQNFYQLVARITVYSLISNYEKLCNASFFFHKKQSLITPITLKSWQCGVVHKAIHLQGESSDFDIYKYKCTLSLRFRFGSLYIKKQITVHVATKMYPEVGMYRVP